MDRGDQGGWNELLWWWVGGWVGGWVEAHLDIGTEDKAVSLGHLELLVLVPCRRELGFFRGHARQNVQGRLLSRCIEVGRWAGLELIGR